MALTFLVQDFERQGRFPGTGETGKYDQFFFEQTEGDVLEVVEASISNYDLSWHLEFTRVETNDALGEVGLHLKDNTKYFKQKDRL